MTRPDLRRMLERRAFLRHAGFGLGAAALHELEAPLRVLHERSRGHGGIVPRAKRVIWLCMAGGPSQFETFDPKPRLAAMDGQPMPESFTKGQPIAQLQGQALRCLAPQFRFQRRGKSGIEVADVLPHMGSIVDELCVIRSMRTDQINHDPAHTVMNTGTSISGRPSMGAWVNYGIGSESQDLPGFVVLTSVGGRDPQPIVSRQWSAGFLPGHHQGVEFHSAGDPVHYVRDPAGVSREGQREVIDAINALNSQRSELDRDAERETRIQQYELAFRMQAAVPELMDLRGESRETMDLYGVDRLDGSFAANCLLARRLAERGVRFIQLYHRGWDHHGDLVRYMNVCTRLCDRPAAALITDLRRRGLLEDTLVVWGGEFGRTPMFQGKGKDPGRDHHIRSFTMCLAGAGVRGGHVHGSSDELGYHVAENPVHVRDLHATMLHLLGIDHERLAVRHQGLDMRLTGVEPARVVSETLG